MTELQAFTSRVHRAMVGAASEAIMPWFGRLTSCQIRQKDIGEVVAAADLQSKAILSAELTEILPDACVVGDEAASACPGVLDRLSSSRCWIIDPLDGTSNFASGQRPFGIMVTLAEAGDVVGGWILDPISGRFCHATRDGGAWVEGKRIVARDVFGRRPLLAIFTLFGDARLREEIASKLADRCEIVPMPRCAAHQYPSIALGESDIALYARTLPWDHSAGTIFLNESGGRVARLDGSPYLVHDPQPNMIAARSPRLWDEFANYWHVLPKYTG